MNDDYTKAPVEKEPADQTAAAESDRAVTEVEADPRVTLVTDGETSEINVSCAPIASGDDLHAFIDELVAAGHKAWGNHNGLYREQASTERTDVPETLIDPESRRG